MKKKIKKIKFATIKYISFYKILIYKVGAKFKVRGDKLFNVNQNEKI